MYDYSVEHDLLNHWLEKLKNNLPKGQKVLVSLKVESKGQFRVAFRTRLYKHDLIAEAQAYEEVDAINRAGDILMRQIFRERHRREGRRHMHYYTGAVA